MANDILSTSCDVKISDKQKQGLAYIQVDNLVKKFSDKPDSLGLEGLSFGIEKGKVTAIIGESGSGKSTLLRLIYGLQSPDTGEIRLNGWKVPGPEDKLIPGHESMRLVSQHFDDLNTYANVWENVASRLSNTNLQEKHDKTAIALNSLGILRLAKQRVVDLSGGEKQRVAIARALVTGPEVLLMDEPFNQVDASFRDHLQQDIRRIVHEMGITVIMVSHDPAEVLAMADALLILKEGKLQASGTPFEIYNIPPNAYSASLLARSNLLNAKEARFLLPDVRVNNTIVIHPEWIRAEHATNGAFIVVDVFFKGFFEEVLLEHTHLQLRVINYAIATYHVGERVDVSILRYVDC
ncbi:ABC transporter ATP-binding protein [Olivibacter sp. SDN3]|uniref:ABC transporter ATP-binding protein n=1 Tax=Olivibacter sp. SDN3 TaxID=2764720 RepID=UPI001650F479|nr:ABC transporter ATP-binding protein [Olivibacter sp. SDN3]QNL50427.1 ABC transporter ATP-binding protein [Olivibacter sp. SDN3]